MEVDQLITLKGKATAASPSVIPPPSPTPGGISKALPSGLSFSKRTLAGMPPSLITPTCLTHTVHPDDKGKKQSRKMEDNNTNPPKHTTMEIDTTPPTLNLTGDNVGLCNLSHGFQID
jgi:hypothetical protein